MNDSSPDAGLSQELYRKLFVLTFLGIMLLSFLSLIREFLITVILAATASGLLFPLRRKTETLLKGRRKTATVLVLVMALLMIGVPVTGILTVAAQEALQVSQAVRPWFEAQMNKPAEEWQSILDWFPYLDHIRPYQTGIMESASDALQTFGQHFTKLVSAAAMGTVGFIFKFFIGVYAAFFFLNDGDVMLKTALGYLPLTEQETRNMSRKGLLIIQSVIKSLFVIGVIQGLLVSLAFFVLGLQGAVFWGMIVAILSAIPGLGAPIIWIPAVIYLVISERFMAGIGLTVWGAGVVGLVDNFLRPIIIGQDTKVPELMILLSILGGLAAFGVSGIILGPVLLSILMSALGIYSKVFQRLLVS